MWFLQSDSARLIGPFPFADWCLDFRNHPSRRNNYTVLHRHSLSRQALECVDGLKSPRHLPCEIDLRTRTYRRLKTATVMSESCNTSYVRPCPSDDCNCCPLAELCVSRLASARPDSEVKF